VSFFDSLSQPITNPRADIGEQATQLIAASESPLSILRHLSQSFPAFASALARRVTVSEAVKEEVTNNGMKMQQGMNMVWLNGAPLEGEPTPFACVYLFHSDALRAYCRTLACFV
jgi:UDP-glucose:glycoprotein glucosyltransferase